MVSFHKVREHFRKKGETHVDTYERRGQGSPAVAPSGEYQTPADVRPKDPGASTFASISDKINRAYEAQRNTYVSVDKKTGAFLGRREMTRKEAEDAKLANPNLKIKKERANGGAGHFGIFRRSEGI